MMPDYRAASANTVSKPNRMQIVHTTKHCIGTRDPPVESHTVSCPKSNSLYLASSRSWSHHVTH